MGCVLPYRFYRQRLCSRATLGPLSDDRLHKCRPEICDQRGEASKGPPRARLTIHREPASTKNSAAETRPRPARARLPCMNWTKRPVLVKRFCLHGKEELLRKTHVVIQTLDYPGVDEDAGGDTVEDADGEERRARVWIVCRVESDTDGDANRGNELRESGN